MNFICISNIYICIYPNVLMCDIKTPNGRNFLKAGYFNI